MEQIEQVGVSFHDCQKATARIYNLKHQVEGAGFLISSRYLLTCAHVVINALNIKQMSILNLPQQELSLDFPSSEDQLSRRGKVVIWQPCPTFFDTKLEKATFGEDIALLELNEPVSSSCIKPITLVCLKPKILNQEQLKFSIYGFPKGSDNGKRTDGEILTVQGIRWLQLQVKENRPLILGGYSGSPLFSETSQRIGIVGMTVASKYYYSKNQEQYRGGKEAYAIPGLALGEVWLKQGLLIECLKSCDPKWIEKAYNHCRQRDWNTKLPQKIEEYVQDLYQYSQQNENENYLLDFVIYLVTKTDIYERLKVQLRQWADKAYQVTELQFGEKCDHLKESLAVKQSSNQAQINSRLWIIITEDKPNKQRYQIYSAYYIKDINNYDHKNRESYKKIELNSPSIVTRSQLQNRNYIYPDLQEIIDKIPDHQSLWIEFFLPFFSLNLMPDRWLIKDDYDTFPLGKLYPVSVRVFERSDYQKPYRYASIWQDKWQPQHMKQVSEQGLVSCDSPANDISSELRREEILGVRCVSPIETHEKKLHILIMQRGISIALWCCRELNSCSGAKTYQLLLETYLNNLPQELCDTRQLEPDDENHLAHHISLLWDNPTKLPFDAPTFSDQSKL